MPIGFVTADAFAPEAAPWAPVGPVADAEATGADLRLRLQDSPLSIRLSVLSERCVRVRFSPYAGADLWAEASHGVVERPGEPIALAVREKSAALLVAEAGSLRLEVDLAAFGLRIFRAGRLVCADRPGQGILWRPGGHGVACIKERPAGAIHCGFGEKAGATLSKTGLRLTNFNFDNFIYARAPVPPGEEAGPLNAGEPLYASIPFAIEIDPAPAGERKGAPACWGLFLDNVSQSYFDLSGDPAAPGRMVFGAQFGELDYYVLLGDGVPELLEAFTRMTGRGGMPPAWAFGFHQGCYGWFDRARVEAVARAYRDARIPIDGLHIDIDLQNNYRVFTHSEAKFPDAPGMMQGLHAAGFKCSTVVTPLITTNPLDESGFMAPFAERQALLDAGCLIWDVRAGRPLPVEGDDGPPAEIGLFSAGVSYGANRGFNPYPYPPLVPNRDGVTPLGAEMNYPDLGRPEAREIWSRHYAHLLRDVGLDMIWQDMMCPAAAVSAATPEGTLPLDLMTHDGQGWVPHGVCHNAYASFLLQATDDGLRMFRPDLRPFILARGGYAGLQRYAALWTGDNGSSWDFLRCNVPQVVGLGLSGVPISGADVGGFAPGPIPSGTLSASEMRDGRVVGGVTDPELFVRWMQAGAFLPWYRNHYLGYDKEYQEVYAFPEPVPEICRRWIELRYRLLPVFWDAMYEWTRTGMPITRALFLNDPDDPEVYLRLDDQFFLGRDILVAPVLEPAAEPGGMVSRDVWLPAGSAWFPMAPDGPPLAAPLSPPLEGGRALRVEVALGEMPLFVRAGAIVPMRSRVEQYVGELAANPLEIVVFPGPDASHLLYQDDGITLQAEREQAFRATRIETSALPGGGTRVRLAREHDRWKPPEPFVLLRFPGIARPAAVSVAGVQVACVGAAELPEAAGDAWTWDERTGSALVKVFDQAASMEIAVGAATPGATGRGRKSSGRSVP